MSAPPLPQAPKPLIPRPPISDKPKFARWMLFRSKWGIITTSGGHKGGTGMPFGNVANVADFMGSPLFYLFDEDPTPQDFAVNKNISVCITEKSFRTEAYSAEMPLVPRLTLSGKVNKVETQDPLLSIYQMILFDKFPEMRTYSSVHSTGFSVYKMEVDNVFLLNQFGPADIVPVQEYVELGMDKPPTTEYAKVARWMVNKTGWGVISTTSTAVVKGEPFGNIADVADNEGSPLFYIPAADVSAQDLAVDNTASVCISEKSFDLYNTLGYTAELPLSGRLTLSGTINKIAETDPSYTMLKGKLFAKFPEMREYPESHDWGVYAMKVESVYFLDFFGGAPEITVQDYYNA